jgi:hypothetical protein
LGHAMDTARTLHILVPILTPIPEPTSAGVVSAATSSGGLCWAYTVGKRVRCRFAIDLRLELGARCPACHGRRHDRRHAACHVKGPWRETGKEGEDPMKESTLAKITASVAVAKGMAQKALAASPNPLWTEYELQCIDEWIATQDGKLNRSEAIRRLVEMGLKAK